jgi:hypothetical protein
MRPSCGQARSHDHSDHRWLLAGCKSAAFAGHFGEALRTADGGNIRPLVHALLGSSFNSPHSSQRSKTRTSAVASAAVRARACQATLVLICDADGDDFRGHPPLPTSDHLNTARANLLRACSSWPSLDTDAAKVNSPAIHVPIQPGDERVLVVRVATHINPVMQNV